MSSSPPPPPPPPQLKIRGCVYVQPHKFPDEKEDWEMMGGAVGPLARDHILKRQLLRQQCTLSRCTWPLKGMGDDHLILVLICDFQTRTLIKPFCTSCPTLHPGHVLSFVKWRTHPKCFCTIKLGAVIRESSCKNDSSTPSPLLLEHKACMRTFAFLAAARSVKVKEYPNKSSQPVKWASKITQSVAPPTHYSCSKEHLK